MLQILPDRDSDDFDMAPPIVRFDFADDDLERQPKLGRIGAAAAALVDAALVPD